MAGRKPGARALVIGCPDAKLKAVDRDVRAMARMLCERGFAVDVRARDAATRRGILEGYDELIAGIEPGAPAVVYYAGHGFHGIVEGSAGPVRRYQGICPSDFHTGTGDDFRGITSWELSCKQLQLTRRTCNVTVILDCCYAAQMSRGDEDDWPVRRLPGLITHGLDAHLAALRERYPAEFAAVDALGSDNPDAVRLAACKQDGGAFEYRAADGEYRGAFTDALLELLAEIRDTPVSWAALENALRGRVQQRNAAQRPAIEGPAQRAVFSLAELDDARGGGAPIIDMGDGFQLQAGRLMGVMPGDVYAAMPPDRRSHRADDAIAELRVREVAATSAELDVVKWHRGGPDLLSGAFAVPIEQQLPRHAVAVDVPEHARRCVEDAIAAARTLCVAAPRSPAPLATLRVAGTALTIEDAGGVLGPAMQFPADLPRAIAALARRGAAQLLRGLEGEHGVLASEVEIELGTAEHGRFQPMPAHGDALALRDRLCVRVKSTSERPLFAHVFNLGLDDDVASLTRFAPGGVPLTPKDPEHVLGSAFDGSLPGLALSWPPDMPSDAIPRRDEIAVIVTSAPANLRSLETAARAAVSRSAGSKLEQLIAQIQDGLPRSTRGEQAIDGFLVALRSWLLHPRQAAIADVSFAIDPHPLRRAAARVPGAWLSRRDPAGAGPTSPDTISIEIEDLVIEDGSTLPADLRIDTLVCTRGDRPSCHAASTRRWRGAVRGTRLDLERPVVFHGVVQDFVELHVWVSRDAGDTLEQLLARPATRAGVQDAVDALALDRAGPSLPWAAVVGGSAALARIARDALDTAARESLGLWRACFFATERYGTGRHPEVGMQRTPSFSASLRITQRGTAEGLE